MDSTCRLCAGYSSSLTSVYDQKAGRLLVDMITIICPIRIEVTDDLPQQICSKCLKVILDATELREKSVQSDRSFRSNEIQPLLDTVVIKKEVDPFQTMVFESEYKQDSESESSSEEEVINYEPTVKKKKLELHCEQCGRIFTTRSHFTVHMRDAHKDPEYSNLVKGKAKCHICGIEVTFRQNLLRHIKRYHDPSLPFPCNKCPNRYQSEARLKTHEFKDHLDSYHESVFETNVKDHLGNSVKSEAFNCNECDATFTEEKLLVNHCRRFHTTLSDSFGCQLCDALFTNRQNLTRHYSRFHLNELKHECNICSKKFFTVDYLYRHQARAHEKDSDFSSKLKEAYKSAGELVDDTCKYCNQTFNGSKYRLERHLVTMHESELERTFQCDICSKKFLYYASLKIHLDVHRKKKREEELPFKCPKCSRSFVDEEKLKSHLDTRHNPNLYVCHICGKSFNGSSGNHYEAHMRRHNNIRNYQCQQCPQNFFTSSELVRHLTTHSDARPFLCPHEGCGMRFKTNYICKKHFKRHTIGFRRKKRYFLKVSSDLL